ncbi:MAG: Trp family transcriptional regulator [Candidatus Paceibacteria bacterium]
MSKHNNQKLSSFLQRALEEDNLDLALKVLLTDQEQEEFTKRVQILSLLEDGMTQREVSERLGVSLTTVTRGSKELQQYGDKLKNLLP